MTGNYQGHYLYQAISISFSAPEQWGVYYCGYIDLSGNLQPLYIGRAAGQFVTIRSRLQDHLREENWPDVTHFGFRTCTTQKEAIDLEVMEIPQYQPRYNTLQKVSGW